MFTNPYESIFNILNEIDSKLNRLEKKIAEEPSKRYTVSEFAKLTDTSEQTVRLWVKKGLIVGEKLGRKIYINEDQFQEGLQEVKSLKYKR